MKSNTLRQAARVVASVRSRRLVGRAHDDCDVMQDGFAACEHVETAVIVALYMQNP